MSIYSNAPVRVYSYTVSIIDGVNRACEGNKVIVRTSREVREDKAAEDIKGLARGYTGDSSHNSAVRRVQDASTQICIFLHYSLPAVETDTNNKCGYTEEPGLTNIPRFTPEATEISIA